MKTKLIRILSIFLSLIFICVGCTKITEPIKTQTYTDLIETDSLLLYTTKMSEPYTRELISLFEKQYDVDVELVVVEGTTVEYSERVINDLLSGAGPDVLFLYNLFSADLAKMALNHCFLDLTDILAEDPDFSVDDYVSGVFEVGQIKERQYMIPLCYELQLMLSSAMKLEKLKYSWSDITTTAAFLNELARMTPEAKNIIGFRQMLDYTNRFRYLFAASGISLIDYNMEEVLPEEQELHDFLDAYKLYFPYDYDGTGQQRISSDGHRKLMAEECVFYYPPTLETLYCSISIMKFHSTNFVLDIVPSQEKDIIGDVRSGLVAINENSANTLNAYRFIKFMLSEEIQENDGLRGLGTIPVHKDAIQQLTYEAPAIEQVGSFEIPNFEESALTDEEAEQIIDMLMNVDRFTIAMPVMSDMLMESMLPYFKDEASYKDCLAELRSKLTFYLSE